MKNKRLTHSGFFRPSVLLGLGLASGGAFLGLSAFSISWGASAITPESRQEGSLLSAPRNVGPEVLTETGNGKTAAVVILLKEQADVSAAYRMKDQNARGWYVYDTLTKHAARTQAQLRSFLTAQGVSVQSFWAANMIIATVDRSLVEALAARNDVARIDSNRPVRWIEAPEVAAFKVAVSPFNVPFVPEWGVTNVNAPSVWNIGFTGDGIVIGQLDTGTRWTHAALKNSYRGWNGVAVDHNFNWHDAIHSG